MLSSNGRMLTDTWMRVLERTAADTAALSVAPSSRPTARDDASQASLIDTLGAAFIDLRGFLQKTSGGAENLDAEIDVLGWSGLGYKGVQLCRLRLTAGSQSSTTRPDGNPSTAKTWYEADTVVCRGGLTTPQVRAIIDGQTIACVPTFGYPLISLRAESFNPASAGAIDSLLLLLRRASQPLGMRAGVGKRLDIIAAAGTALATAGGTLNTSAIYLGDANFAQLDIKNTNGATGPTAAPAFQVQLSYDNSNWNDFGAPYQANTGNNVVTSWGGIELPSSAHFVRLQITRPTGQATTYEALVEKDVR